MERLSHVYDCTSNLIFFEKYVYDDKNNLIALSNEQHVKAVRTLLSPTLILTFKNQSICYYYRPLSLHTTILIGVVFSNNTGRVNEYIENPPESVVLTLIKKRLLDEPFTISRN